MCEELEALKFYSMFHGVEANSGAGSSLFLVLVLVSSCPLDQL